jgi:hypothetical protein
MMTPDGAPPYVGRKRPDDALDRPPAPGQTAVILAGLTIGILLMGIQLWLLTVALELFLAGEGERVWQLALVSGAIFLGGLAMLWILRRRPEVRRVVPSEGGLTALLRVRGRRS